MTSDRQKITTYLESAEPLVVARFAVDELHAESQKDVTAKMQQGVPIDDVLKMPLERDPLEDAAHVILDLYHSKEGVSANHWFALRTTLQTRRQRILQSSYFNGRGPEKQLELANQSSYEASTESLAIALSMLKNNKDPSRKKEIVGAISKLAILSLLTKSNQDSSLAVISNARADIFYRVDMTYQYFNSGIAARYNKASLQVKPGSRPCSSEGEKLVVYANTALEIEQQPYPFYATRLMAREAQTGITVSQNDRLLELADRFEKSIQQQHEPFALARKQRARDRAARLRNRDDKKV